MSIIKLDWASFWNGYAKEFGFETIRIGRKFLYIEQKIEEQVQQELEKLAEQYDEKAAKVRMLTEIYREHAYWNDKITFIKLLRIVGDMGLKEAKDILDTIDKERGF